MNLDAPRSSRGRRAEERLEQTHPPLRSIGRGPGATALLFVTVGGRRPLLRARLTSRRREIEKGRFNRRRMTESDLQTHGALAVLLVQVIVDDLQQLGVPRQFEQDPFVQLRRGGGGGGGGGTGEIPEHEGTARDGDE